MLHQLPLLLSVLTHAAAFSRCRRRDHGRRRHPRCRNPEPGPGIESSPPHSLLSPFFEALIHADVRTDCCVRRKGSSGRVEDTAGITTMKANCKLSLPTVGPSWSACRQVTMPVNGRGKTASEETAQKNCSTVLRDTLRTICVCVCQQKKAEKGKE